MKTQPELKNLVNSSRTFQMAVCSIATVFSKYLADNRLTDNNLGFNGFVHFAWRGNHTLSGWAVHKHVMRSNIWPTHPQNKFSILPPLFLSSSLTTNQTHIAPSLPLPCHNQLNNPVKAQDFSWDPSITHVTLLPSPLQLLMPALML